MHPSQPQNRTSTPATATMAGPCARPHHNKYLSQASQPQPRWRTLIGPSPTIVGKYLSPPPHAATAKMLSSYLLGHNHGKYLSPPLHVQQRQAHILTYLPHHSKHLSLLPRRRPTAKMAATYPTFLLIIQRLMDGCFRSTPLAKG
jgi:hypothetical protein